MKRLNLLLTFIFAFFPIVVAALDMNECIIGDTVYIDDWFDEKVEIIDKNYSNNTVLVRTNNGKQKWIKPSELMGQLGKIGEDIAEDFLLEGAKWFFKEVKKEYMRRKENEGFHVCNQTSDSIYVSIAYWTGHAMGTKGWYLVNNAKCKKIVFDLDYVNYYLHIEQKNKSILDGNSSYCLHPNDKFSIVDASRACIYPNKKAIFHKFDTGKTGNYFKVTIKN